MSASPTPRRDSLTKRIGQLREHKMVLGALDFIASQKAEAERRLVQQREKEDRLLAVDSPYRRPCYLCGVRGACEHREPLVELAYAEVRNRRRV